MGDQAIDLSAGLVENEYAPPTGIDLSGGVVSPVTETEKTNATRWAQDVAYPGLGAMIGGAVGSVGGPIGAVAGGALGAAAMENIKLLGRQAMGEKTPTGSELAVDLGAAGAGGAMQEFTPAIKAALGKTPVMLTAAQKLGLEFGVPLTKAQQEGGTMRVAFENVIRRSFGTQGIFRKQLEEPQNAALANAASQIADQIAPRSATQREVGTFVQGRIQAAREAAGNVYAQSLEQISAAGARDVPINLERLKAPAKEILDALKLPQDYSAGVSNVESRQRAIDFLKQFLTTTKTTQEGTQAAVEVPKKLTFEEARRLRTTLFSLTNSGQLDIGKGQLAHFNHELDAVMKAALGDVGRSDLAQMFGAASGNFHKVSDLIDKQTIKRLANTGAPELVADILLSKGTESSTLDLRQLIGPQNMKSVERALWEKMFERTLESSNEVMAGARLNQAWDKLGPDVKTAIWGNNPENLSKINRFIDLASRVGLKKEVGEPVTQSSLMAFGQFAKGIAAMGAGAKYVFGMSPSGSVELALGSGAAVTLGPAAIAKWLVRPGAIDVATQALKTPLDTKKGVELGYRILMAIEAQQMQDAAVRRVRAEMEKEPVPPTYGLGPVQ